MLLAKGNRSLFYLFMRFLITGICLLSSLMSISAELPEKMIVFVGTYTGGASKGIYTYELSKDGNLRQVELAAETPSPSFLAIHPNKRFLYAVNELSEFEGKKQGSVTAFQIEPSWKLKQINVEGSGGGWPCHVIVDKEGKNVLLANYGGGNVAVLPIREDGSLGLASALVQHQGSSVNESRQQEPHAHSINLDRNNRFAVAADLGTDDLFVYRYDSARGSLTANDPASTKMKPGSGPRHLAFHPNGKFAYAINELDCTVVTLSYNETAGVFRPLQRVSTLGADSFKDRFSTAEIQVHPSGKFVYGSNRGHDSIVVFRTRDDGAGLDYVENESTQGKTPRNFGIDPTGTYLIAANQDSDSMVVFRINSETGELDPVGEPVPAPKPVCVKFFLP